MALKSSISPYFGSCEVKVKALIAAPIRIIKAIFQARRIMKRYQPDAVLGMGAMFLDQAVLRMELWHSRCFT